MAVIGNYLFILLLVVMTWCAEAQRDLFLDSPTACGKTFPAGDREVFRVKPRGTVGVSNPPTNCIVYFESSQASSNYKFEIVVEAASFRDCGLQLRIFDGKGTGGNYIRVLGCGSTTSTAQFYSKDRSMSLMLTRTQNQYFFGSDFQLKIQLYYDSEGHDEYIGQYPTGATVAIVPVFLDSPTACGKTFPAGDREVFRVKPRGTVGVSNPPTNCIVYFESSQASSNYKFEIVVEAASFRDCGLLLRIFDGNSTGSNYLGVLGYGSTTSTAQFYSKDRSISLMLTRTQNQYFFRSDFQLKIQLYYDSEVPTGVTSGIVPGKIVIIAAAILWIDF